MTKIFTKFSISKIFYYICDLEIMFIFMSFKPTKYQIKCVADGRICEDSGWMLDFPNSEKP